jgi:hypothetical protein
MTQNRPQASEYAPYYEKYVALVPDGEIAETLEAQLREMKLLLGNLSDRGAEFRYAAGKWSIKEVLGHISDTERIFAYRLLRIARGDQTSLEGFEQDDYVKTGNFSARPLAELLEEFAAARRATIALVRSLDEAAGRGQSERDQRASAGVRHCGARTSSSRGAAGAVLSSVAADPTIHHIGPGRCGFFCSARPASRRAGTAFPYALRGNSPDWMRERRDASGLGSTCLRRGRTI